MIDTHVHLNYRPLVDDLEAVIQRANQVGVSGCIVPGTTLVDSVSAVEISNRFNNVWAEIGFHPEHANQYVPGDVERLKELVRANKRIVSVGEVGLDYYHFEGCKSEKDKEAVKIKQRALFKEMLILAVDLDLPAVIHSRNAFNDVFEILALSNSQSGSKGKMTERCLIHCFVGDWNQARAWLDLGCMISLTGIITYKKNQDLREVVKKIPLDRIMLETDGPFLPPDGYRGDVCEPYMLPVTAKCLADIKGIEVDEVDAVTTENANKFFGINLG